MRLKITYFERVLSNFVGPNYINIVTCELFGFVLKNVDYSQDI